MYFMSFTWNFLFYDSNSSLIFKNLLTPNNLASLCHKAQLAYIHLNDSTFGNNTQSCI